MAPRIFIAEDNDPFATALETLLRRRGLSPERCADGREALARILAAPPDALLLDLRLPGLSGVDLLRRLRQEPRTRELPVIIMSGVLRGEQNVRAAQALGVRHYLEKPFPAETLLEALRQVLKPAGSAGETLDRHLHRAFSVRFSGRYQLKNAGGERSLLLVGGLPVLLRPGFVHRDFGDFLQRRGLISKEEYAFYRDVGNYRHEVLVQMGCLDYGQLLEEKLEYLASELIAAFGQPPMTVEEQPFTIPPDLQLITVNLPDILCRGHRLYPAPDADLQFMKTFGERFVALAPGYYRHGNFLTLEAAEKSLLARLDGTRTLAACLAGVESLVRLARTLHQLEMIRFAEAPLAVAEPPEFPLRRLFNAVGEGPPAGFAEEEIELPEETLESFADLVEEAANSPAAPPGPPLESAAVPTAAPPSDLGARVRERLAAMEGKNYYEIFGLNQGRFSFDQLKERYFQITREFGPDVLMQLSGAEASKVEEILSTVSSAYNTLSDVVKKERYDELLGSDKIGLGQKGDDRFQAQVQFQSGKVFIEMEEWGSAEQSLQDACNIAPNNGLYLAHLAWAIYRNPVNVSSRAMLEKARQTLNKALTLERTADGFAFRGRLLFDAGQDALAEVEFGKALKLDARQLMARAGLREIQEKREQEKRGLFRKIFH